MSIETTNKLKQNSILFIAGFVQLIVLSSNMYCIATANFKWLIITAFLTNLAFSYCVTKLAFSSWLNRLIYSLGCTFGCFLGTWIATKF